MLLTGQLIVKFHVGGARRHYLQRHRHRINVYNKYVRRSAHRRFMLSLARGWLRMAPRGYAEPREGRSSSGSTQSPKQDPETAH